jgi:hypothetical protein
MAHKQTLDLKAWDTFQMSYNELRNTLWANGMSKKKLCGVDSFWHAMASTKAPNQTLDLKLEKLSK